MGTNWGPIRGQLGADRGGVGCLRIFGGLRVVARICEGPQGAADDHGRPWGPTAQEALGGLGGPRGTSGGLEATGDLIFTTSVAFIGIAHPVLN